MLAALPAAGPDRVRTTLALLAELEKYSHMQRQHASFRGLPLRFNITIEKRVNGRIQETTVEVSMEELREQLKEILRSEGNGVLSTPQSPTMPRWESTPSHLRRVKSDGCQSVQDVSIFPTHIHDGRPLPEEKTICTICLEEFFKGDEIKTIPCLHFYHCKCIDEWLKRSKCCPICNAHVDYF